MTKKTFAETFSQKIIENLKQGTAPWQRPWEESLGQAPFNPVSGSTYKGVNRLNLTISSPNEDPRWVTFKQAKSQKWRVKKGSVAEKIIFWSFTKEENVLDENGKPILDENGDKLKETVLLERPIMNQFSVFHASQLETEDKKEIPAFDYIKTEYKWNPQEKAEEILKNSGAIIEHKRQDFAFYNYKNDLIVLPLKEQFKTADRYYATALHELGHWTGNVARLNREFKQNTNAIDYAKEELRAEIASWLLGEDLGIGHDPNQHLSYVKSWVKALENDEYEIFRAVKEAEKIKEYILSLELKKELVQGVEIKEELKISQENISEEKLKQESKITQENTYLNVPFKEKNEAKKLGAKWDNGKKSWYAPIGSDLNNFQNWDIKKEQTITSPILSPQEEFKEVLLEMGLIVGEPIMDGSIQRVAVLGAESGKDGAYQAYADGMPNGWVQNHKTGEKIKWVATGQVLNSQEKEKLALEAEQRQKQRVEKRNKIQNEAIKKAAFTFHKAEKDLSILPENYLANKGFSKTDKFSDVRCFLPQENSNNYVLLIPGYDKNGKIQTVQYINQNGEKNFAKDCPKKGAVHIIDLQKSSFPKKLTEISDKTEIYIAEGYATGASINLATNKPVVVAFDAGNLAEVAKIVREAHPNANITICADHDHKKEINVGLKKASEAGKLIKAKVVLPLFNNTEKLKGLTDFNDLHVARQGEKGLKAVLNSINQTKELER